MDPTGTGDFISMSRTFANVLTDLSKCQGHEVVPGVLTKGRTAWMQTSTLVATATSWKAQFMYQNKLSTKALSSPFKREFSGAPLIDVGDVSI